MILFGTNLFQIFNCVFVPKFCHLVDYLWLLWENSSFENVWRINCLDGNFVLCIWIQFTINKTMNKLTSTKAVSLYSWSVHRRRESHNLFTVGSKLEPLDQNFTKFTFLSTLAATLPCYARRNWKTRVLSRFNFWIYGFVKKTIK